MVMTEPPVTKANTVYVKETVSCSSEGTVYRDIHGDYWETIKTEWTTPITWVVPCKSRK